MEFIESFKLTDIARVEKEGLDRKDLAKRVADTFLYQIVDTAYFHCDPHPGNLLVDGLGRLCVIDFGSTRRPCAFDVTPSPRRALHAIAVTRRHAQVSAPRSPRRRANI